MILLLCVNSAIVITTSICRDIRGVVKLFKAYYKNSSLAWFVFADSRLNWPRDIVKFTENTVYSQRSPAVSRQRSSKLLMTRFTINLINFHTNLSILRSIKDSLVRPTLNSLRSFSSSVSTRSLVLDTVRKIMRKDKYLLMTRYKRFRWIAGSTQKVHHNMAPSFCRYATERGERRNAMQLDVLPARNWSFATGYGSFVVRRSPLGYLFDELTRLSSKHRGAALKAPRSHLSAQPSSTW